MSHPDIWHTKLCLALGYLRGLVEVWGEIWPDAWLDLDSARLQRSVSQPLIFSTSRDIYSHKLSQNRTPGRRKEEEKKSQRWQWLFLIGSSCLVVFHPPTRTATEGRKGRGAVLCYTEPLGAVLYRIYFSLRCSTVRQSLGYRGRGCDFNRANENIALSLMFQ